MMTTEVRRPWLALFGTVPGHLRDLDGFQHHQRGPASVISGLHAPLDQALWVVDSYPLTFAALLIVATRLGDLFSPRRLFIAGLMVFAVASALCGASQTPGQLVAARVLQGAGAAAMAPQPW